MGKIIKGFKAFNPGLISNYNMTFKENTWYHQYGPIRYRQNGFHFCRNLEDTLKYYTALKEDVDIARVIGAGTIETHWAEGYGTDEFEVIIASDIKIENVLTREEIIEEMNEHQYSLDRMIRFISMYKLTDEEIEYLRKGFEYDILNKYIDYYQKGDKDAFTRKR